MDLSKLDKKKKWKSLLNHLRNKKINLQKEYVEKEIHIPFFVKIEINLI